VGEAERHADRQEELVEDEDDRQPDPGARHQRVGDQQPEERHGQRAGADRQVDERVGPAAARQLAGRPRRRP
jgi:hypothetical protein